MPRDPEKRRRSREADKLRKRARRLAARLEKDLSAMDPKSSQYKGTAEYIESLRTTVESSKVKVSGSLAQRAVKLLKSVPLVGRGYKAVTNRRNAVFSRQVNLAGRGMESGGLSQKQVKVFYRATQRFWEGLPAAKRNAAILEGLGVDSLEAAFRKVLDANAEALGYEVEDTEDEGFFDDTDYSEVQGSPDYLYFVKSA